MTKHSFAIIRFVDNVLVVFSRVLANTISRAVQLLSMHPYELRVPIL